MQLRALLLAHAAIDAEQARHLFEAAADDFGDPGTAQHLTETFLHLIRTDAADFGNMHEVEDPRAEALALLTIIDDAIRQRMKSGRFNR